MQTETQTQQTVLAHIGLPRIVVVGGGFGGLELVKALASANYQTVLIDKYNHHTFQPLLYQVATSGLETSSIVFPFRKRFQRQRKIFFRMGEVIAIRPDDRQIDTSIGSISYDYLVLATGANTNFYGLKDVEQYALGMKSIVDAIKLRNTIIRNFEQALLASDARLRNSLMDFVIVGGGPTGVELAGALAELKKHVFPKDYPELQLEEMDIYLIEAGPRLLSGMSEEASSKALHYLSEMGVRVMLNTAVKSYNGDEVLLNNNEKLLSKTLIWTAGVKANPLPGLKPDCLAPSGRIRVDVYNRVIGYENIFALGDVAVMEGDPAWKGGHPMMAPPAMQQGRWLAKNFKRLAAGKPMLPFRYFDKGSMATIGRNKAVVDLRGMHFQGFFAWYVWMFVHLMYLVGFRNKIFVFFSWLWSYFSYDKSNRLIIGRPQ
ncbi:MAG: NAD(P)/FAD-dependent oxidoreductase [Cyclobacteriaceae bacterium]|nr:NAD(P)/FAD-dependent oxidoreductase [Cyclobacteriaceae bacterium]